MTPEICHGHYVKKAAYDQLSTDLAEALAVLSGFINSSQCDGSFAGCAICSRIAAARALLSKHEKGS